MKVFNDKSISSICHHSWISHCPWWHHALWQFSNSCLRKYCFGLVSLLVLEHIATFYPLLNKKKRITFHYIVDHGGSLAGCPPGAQHPRANWRRQKRRCCSVSNCDRVLCLYQFIHLCPTPHDPLSSLYKYNFKMRWHYFAHPSTIDH